MNKVNKNNSLHNKRISILQWYATHYIRYVSTPLYHAGLKLQNHWETISRSTVSAINYTSFLGSVDKNKTNTAINNTTASWHEFQEAMRFVGGPGLHTMLLEVVCKNMPIGQFEKKQKWRRGCGSIVLHIALYRLALFYKKVRKQKNDIQYDTSAHGLESINDLNRITKKTTS